MTILNVVIALVETNMFNMPFKVLSLLTLVCSVLYMYTTKLHFVNSQTTSGENSLPDNQKLSRSKFPKQLQISGPEVIIPTGGFNYCPDTFYGTSCDSIVETKNAVTNPTFLDLLPVITKDGTIFKNENCAFCLGYEELSPWPYEVKCQDFDITNFNESHRNGLQDLIELLNKHCAFSLKGYYENGVYFSQFPRKVIPNKRFRGSHSKVLPNNINIPNFSILFNFGFDGRTHVLFRFSKEARCKDNEIYDVYVKRCREVVCAKGLIPKNGECVLDVDEEIYEDYNMTEDYNYPEDTTPFKIKFRANIHQEKVHLVFDDKVKDMMKKGIARAFGIQAAAIRNLTVTPLFEHSVSRWEPLLNKSKTYIPVKIAFSLYPYEVDVVALIEKTITFIITKTFLLQIGNEKYNASSIDGSGFDKIWSSWCFDGRKERHELRDIRIVKTNSGNETFAAVKLKKNGELYEIGQYDFTFVAKKTVNETTVDGYVIICAPKPQIADSKCPRVYIEKEEYQLLANRSILYHNAILDIDSYEYVYRDNNTTTIAICVTNAYKNQNQLKWTSVCGGEQRILVKIQQYATLVLCVLSAIGAVLTLVVYIFLHTTRNLPGCCIMNLSVAIFMVHVIFLFIGIASNNAASCKLVAVLLHYSLLAMFSWMNATSYDVYKTFSPNALPHRTQLIRRYIPRYAIYGWGLPLLIVFLCVLLDFAGLIPSVRIGYGSAYQKTTGSSSGERFSLVCWISSPVASIVTFGVPIMLMCFANAVYFGLTICTINSSAKFTNNNSSPAKYRRHKNGNDVHVSLFLRMAAFMGFTWFIGLLSSLVSSFSTPTPTSCLALHIVGLFFVLMNSSHGLFIFFAFVANRRTLFLAQRKMFRFSSQKKQESDNENQPQNGEMMSVTSINNSATVTMSTAL